MKRFCTFMVALWAFQSIFAQYTTESFSSAKMGKKQKIGIYKPEKYSDKQTYPLLVVLSGETLMESVISMVRYYEQFDEMPKCIVVGVFDVPLEDIAITEEVGRPINESARFFEFVSTELAPYIEGKFPIGMKAIIGSEQAGFLLNYYMISPKPVFNTYISLNPVTVPRMGDQFAAVLAEGTTKRTFYYMATSDVENKLNYDTALRFEKSLRSTPAHESVEYHFVDMKGQSVNAAKIEALAQALDLCFDVYKPIGAKEFKTKMETLSTGVFEYLEEKYNTIEKYFGIKKKPLLNDIMADYTAINSTADWESLKKLSKYVEDNGYGKTAMPQFFMAEYYEKTSDYKKALKTYQKAYTQANIDFITGDLITERINRLKSGGKK